MRIQGEAKIGQEWMRKVEIERGRCEDNQKKLGGRDICVVGNRNGIG